MKKFYSDYNQVKTRQIKEMLDDAKIPCFMKNEFIQGASGEIPPHETLPEIWLVDEQWRPKAQQLVDDLEKELNTGGNDVDWHCARCKEVNEGQFMICWQCQEEKPIPL
jgi:hypothetical protein